MPIITANTGMIKKTNPTIKSPSQGYRGNNSTNPPAIPLIRRTTAVTMVDDTPTAAIIIIPAAMPRRRTISFMVSRRVAT
jgi:hypothetical protein